ncbi:hypothetical protein [Cytobacillus kochii]|uniref:hypothetical protein n=1 Tax=Cytobacillus kochii TaxID=859143 RepID=UPI00203AF073|nr:hypothetical protein [Cytobacillus kochii]MCM3324750.1 hypothetical protein [Cytobacillus kochii]MCM3347143.1 hypothetical protein [Cytobacillus kochii]
MSSIEEVIEQYNKLKISLIQSSICLKNCIEDFEKKEYQEKCLSYAKDLKIFKEVVNEQYGLDLCECNKNNREGD